ncbi:hypothetical protein [Natronorubrum texcoconense]|uniref:hypothetical protein n=1 Tax=Natronorubrum texcoconense TaxID=1095776 RepID=UPI0015878D71|nr:hypothetical protein [Natronorubrum texcoconense]
MAKPGRFPGEAAITKSEYSRWLRQISAMNANVIRTYTLHPPAFYDALAEHNVDREEPLLLLQGNWLNEQVMDEAGDMFDSDVLEIQKERTENGIDAVHGNLFPVLAHRGGSSFCAGIQLHSQSREGQQQLL